VNIKEQIETTFSLCISNNCIEIYTDNFDVQDNREDEKKPCYKVEFGTGEFSIITNENEVNFLKIDACILFEKDGKKCDFAVFTDDKFVLVELKQIKKGTKNDNKKKQKLRNKAYKQLENTLKIFTDELDLSKYQISEKLHAIPAIFDLNNPVKEFPKSSTGMNNARVRFLKLYDTELFSKGNKFEFELKY